MPNQLAPNSAGGGAWSTCLDSIITSWRQRYGADIPFLAGTFSFAQQGWWADAYEDFLRFNFGRGVYGNLSSGYYKTITDSALMPVLGLDNLGLADSEYVVSSAGALTPAVVPYDPLPLFAGSAL